MTRMRKWMVVPAMLMAGSIAFAAENDAAQEGEAKFKAMDTNGDGSLTVQEYIGAKQGDEATAARAEFARLDKDRDQKLTMEECKAGEKKQPEQPQQPQ